MMIRLLPAILATLPLVLMAESVVPDRPGFSTGTYTVSPGGWQLEAGIQHSYGRNVGDPDSYTAPLLNLRTGLTQNTELNLLWDGIQFVEGQGQDEAYVMLGAKHRLIESDLYNFSLLGHLSLQEDHLTPFLGLLWDRKLTEKTGLFGTLQVATSIDAGKRRKNFQPAIGLNFSHTDNLSSFVELYADAPLNGDRQASVFDAGLAWMVHENLQLDFNFGLSMDSRSEDFAGFGLAIRL